MKVQCNGCQAVFSVPEDKIPEGKVVRLLCPKCKTPIEVGPNTGSNAVESLPDAAGATPMGMTPPNEEEVGPDLVEEGVRRALTYIPTISRAEQVEQTLSQMDFYVVEARSAPFAVGKLHHNTYDLVVIEERSGKADANTVLQHLQLLPMHSRRRFLLCLLSDELQSLDRITAFRLGVDLIINIKDLQKLKILLIQGLKEHASFYRIFSDEVLRRGQARP